MSNDTFRFRRFAVGHGRCAMKVGTDGVLLGAWSGVDGLRILDVGTGSGLLALMAAQRNPQAQVVGIDIDPDAVSQARENAQESPFGDRISIRLGDVLEMQEDAPFDAVVCNPPYFSEDTLPPDRLRALARNSHVLPFVRLIPKVRALLTSEGTFSVVLPAGQAAEFTALCLQAGLHLNRRCLVRTTERKPPRRALLQYSPTPSAQLEDSTLILTNPDGTRSEPYKSLTADFYL